MEILRLMYLLGNVDGAPNGFSSYDVNYIATELVTGNWGAHVFNHEIGHALNLYYIANNI